MKQWLYNGWCRFKDWILFNYWRRFSNGDHDDLIKFYRRKRWEKNAMNAYVKMHNGATTKIERSGESWYVGDIPHDWEDRINAKILIEKELEKKK